METHLQKYKALRILRKLTGLGENEMMNSRKQEATLARMCLYRYYEECEYYHYEIAYLLGKSRSNVTYHLNNFETYYKQMPELREMYEKFKELINKQS